MKLDIQHAPRASSLCTSASAMITKHHYLHTMPDARTSYEVYIVTMGLVPAGALVFGRPEATRCGDWYGGVDDVASGKCEVTRWQVLNLSRVWLSPDFQRGGRWHDNYQVPGYFDRHGMFRSTLASDVLRFAVQYIGFEYLTARPPVFLDEPYQIDYLLSYCDTSKHKGTIYRAAGFNLYRTNEHGIQTWRLRLPPLTDEQHKDIKTRSLSDARAKRYRAQRAQLAFDFAQGESNAA
jgi:hypothetical protein